jgi:hypothetical protein
VFRSIIVLAVEMKTSADPLHFPIIGAADPPFGTVACARSYLCKAKEGASVPNAVESPLVRPKDRAPICIDRNAPGDASGVKFGSILASLRVPFHLDQRSATLMNSCAKASLLGVSSESSPKAHSNHVGPDGAGIRWANQGKAAPVVEWFCLSGRFADAGLG